MPNVNLKLILSQLLLLVLVACGSGDGPESTVPSSAVATVATGPVSVDEAAAIPLPTYADLVASHERVILKMPATTYDDVYFRALFEDLKANATRARSVGNLVPKGTFQQAVDVCRAGSAGLNTTDSFLALTCKEWLTIVTTPSVWRHLWSYARSASPAFTQTLASFQCDPLLAPNTLDAGNDTKRDALRHSFWQAIVTKRTSENTSRVLGDAHEDDNLTGARTAMDLHNNEVGRRLALRNPTAKESELLLLLEGARYEFIKPDPRGSDFPLLSPLPVDLDTLVYFKYESTFDGVYSGSITNPDSGGPWSLKFTLNQCGNQVKGTFFIVRGAASQQRQVTGILDQQNSILALDISDPLSFQNPQGLTFCTAMKASTLSINGNSFSGAWTSSNCRLGGQIIASK
jgi:hypothetical protein